MNPSLPAAPPAAHGPDGATAAIGPAAPASPARRVCLLGGESSGKTSLARALAAHLGTAWVAEYGRERWLEIGGTFSVDELLHVGREQVAREETALPRARGWLVCDTTALTTLVYSLLDHGTAPPELQALARRPYDVALVCLPDFAFVQDGARRDDAWRRAQHAMTLQLLHDHGQPFHLLAGDLPSRLQQALALLAQAEQTHPEHAELPVHSVATPPAPTRGR